jgi:quercetin dioxygenase-like cupin family protein
MSAFFCVHRDEAPQVLLNRDRDGVEAISRRLITSAQSERGGLFVATVQAPVDYTVSLDYEMIIYFLDGSGFLHCGGETSPVRPGSCALVPANNPLRHTADEDNTVLIVFMPPPDLDTDFHIDSA